jgi:hypothetical protein
LWIAVWSKSHQLRPLERAGKAAKIFPPVSLHVLRHTRGGQLAHAKRAVWYNCAPAWHAATRMTETPYAHYAPIYVAKAIRATFPNLGIADPAVVVNSRCGRKRLVDGIERSALCPQVDTVCSPQYPTVCHGAAVLSTIPMTC